jgi:SAM-dependent methyltransferase
VRASSIAAQDTGPHALYWRFHDAVARAQLTSWLGHGSQRIIDISGPASQAASLAAATGHKVLHVTDPSDIDRGTSGPIAGTAVPRGDARACDRAGTDSPGYRVVAADGNGLEFLADGCAEGVIAEDRTLSRRLAAETLVAEIRRVLRPGGRVLASVDSLTQGMAVLAEQHHWPHLVDLPHADVVLIPWPDGTITRCYGTEQLRELFTSAGFEVDWVRSRTVLSASTVSYLVSRDPRSFRRLVEVELATSADDSVGSQLVISAVLPGEHTPAPQAPT